jgi:hypothetical protein
VVLDTAEYNRNIAPLLEDHAYRKLKDPIRYTVNLLCRHFEDILRLFRHVLTASYFGFAGQFNEKIDGMTMSSPLPPVIANFFTEDFEEMELERAAHKSLCWIRYVDDTFGIWPHEHDTG